jgi:hypothetical protein
VHAHQRLLARDALDADVTLRRLWGDVVEPTSRDVRLHPTSVLFARFRPAHCVLKQDAVRSFAFLDFATERDAEDALSRADTMVPEVVGGAMLVAVYVVDRLVLAAVGVAASSITSTGSVVAVAVAALAASKVYASQFRVRSLAMSRSGSAASHARKMESRCRTAAEGGEQPPTEALNPNERELLSRAARLASLEAELPVPEVLPVVTVTPSQR